MKEEIKNQHILKEEMVSFFSEDHRMLNGVLYLTEDKLSLKAHKIGQNGWKWVNRWLGKKKPPTSPPGFEILLSDIEKVQRGDQGLKNNVLKIKECGNKKHHTILVKDVSSWQNEIRNAEISPRKTG